MQEGLEFSTQRYTGQVGTPLKFWHLGWKQEALSLKVIVGYLVNLKPAWDIGGIYPQKLKNS